MALVICKECRNQVSDKAAQCPKCGAPVNPSGAGRSDGKTLPLASIVAMGSAVASLLAPYFAAVFLVPVALISSAVAYRQSQKIMAVVACVIGLLGMVGVFKTSEKIQDIASASGVAYGNAAGKESRPVITHEAFGRLKEGMSINEAESIVGAAAEEISRTDMAGYRTVMYGWKNPDGSNANAMFQNGALMSKSQFGLR